MCRARGTAACTARRARSRPSRRGRSVRSRRCSRSRSAGGSADGARRSARPAQSGRCSRRAPPAPARARQTAAARVLGRYPVLEPEAKPVEAPRRRPAEERSENQPVERAPGDSEARLVVVTREEPGPFVDGHVPPVPAAAPDQRPRVLGAERECRGARPVARILVAGAFALAADLEPEPEPRGVQETLRRGLRTRQVLDPCEAEVPPPVELRLLRQAPDLLERRADHDLDVDRRRHHSAAFQKSSGPKKRRAPGCGSRGPPMWEAPAAAPGAVPWSGGAPGRRSESPWVCGPPGSSAFRLWRSPCTRPWRPAVVQGALTLGAMSADVK